jgi:hypothetical protein
LDGWERDKESLQYKITDPNDSTKEIVCYEITGGEKFYYPVVVRSEKNDLGLSDFNSDFKKSYPGTPVPNSMDGQATPPGSNQVVNGSCLCSVDPDNPVCLTSG